MYVRVGVFVCVRETRGGCGGERATDFCRSRPFFSTSLRRQWSWVGRVPRGPMFKASEHGDGLLSDTKLFEKFIQTEAAIGK